MLQDYRNSTSDITLITKKKGPVVGREGWRTVWGTRSPSRGWETGVPSHVLISDRLDRDPKKFGRGFGRKKRPTLNHSDIETVDDRTAENFVSLSPRHQPFLIQPNVSLGITGSKGTKRRKDSSARHRDEKGVQRLHSLSKTRKNVKSKSHDLTLRDRTLSDNNLQVLKTFDQQFTNPRTLVGTAFINESQMATLKGRVP